MMARKKGVVAGLQDYGSKHPYVTLALAGTFSYYLYENMTKVQAAAPLTERQKVRQEVLANDGYVDHIQRERMKTAGLGATTSTSTTSSSSHRMPGPGDGETSMYIDPTKSGMFGLGATSVRPMQQTNELLFEQKITKANPSAFLKYDQTQQLSGFSPSARRRVGHAGIGMVSDSYSPKLDTQFENREAMIMGDLKKHQDILGFSGLAPLAGGDWYE